MYFRKYLVLVVIFLLIGVLSSYSYGQILTGSIRGTVKDESGAVLPGVTVELNSPALIGGHKIAITNERGFFRFPNLLPGVYDLTFTLEGFQTLKREGIRVRVDTIVTEDLVLKVAAVTETITVTAEIPVIDVTKSGQSTNWSTDMMDNLPLLRYYYYDLVNSTPGVWSHWGYLDDERSIAYGTSSESSIYLLDGVDVTSPEYGISTAKLNPDVIQEIQVVGIGSKAEYGNFMGATVNIVTKSGSNKFNGGASFFFQNDSLTGNNSAEHIQQLIDAGNISPEEAFPHHREQFYDASFQIGGPIIKDKIWFFTSVWRQVNALSEVGVDPRYYTRNVNTQGFLKGTIQVTQNHKIQGFYNYEWWDNPVPFTPEYESLDSVGGSHGGTPTGSVYLTSVLTDKTFTEIKFNYTGGYYIQESVTGYKGPTYINLNTGIISGGPMWNCYILPSRYGLNATVSHFAEDFISGEHDFKFGVQFSRGRSDCQGGYSAGAQYASYTSYYNGIPFEYRYKYELMPYQYGAADNRIALFMDDTWTIIDRLTLNIGLRYDHNTSWIPDQSILVVDPNTYDWIKSDEIVPGRPNLVKWRTFSPRLGLAYKLTADGKTLLRVNAGRYYDQMAYANWELPSPAASSWKMYAWTGAVWDLVFEDIPSLIAVDPNLRNPYADQFSIGIDREILPNMELSITYMEKWTHDTIGFKPAVGTWDDYYQLITATDPYNGNPIQVYNLIGDSPEIIISNPDWLKNRFRMLSITANKRMSNNWQLSASFTYTEMRGLNALGCNRMTYSENLLWGSRRGRDPNHFLNIEGPMPGERPYSFKILGTYLFPYGISSSINLQIQSGSAWARRAKIYGLNQGSVSVATEQRVNRLPTMHLLDLNVEKTFKIADRYKLHARFNVFNLLNRSNPIADPWLMNYDLLPGQTFLPSRIWLPRRAQLGIKFTF